MSAHEHWQMEPARPSFTSATSSRPSLPYGQMICSTVSGQGRGKACSTSPAGRGSWRGWQSSGDTPDGWSAWTSTRPCLRWREQSPRLLSGLRVARWICRSMQIALTSYSANWAFNSFRIAPWPLTRWCECSSREVGQDLASTARSREHQERTLLCRRSTSISEQSHPEPSVRSISPVMHWRWALGRSKLASTLSM